MADDESPLIGLAHKVFDTLNRWGATKDVKPAKDTTDYSWHAQKVAEANKSPAMKTVTAGTGFTVLCGASDTSTYNYNILN